jgi:hypothetical protein
MSLSDFVNISGYVGHWNSKMEADVEMEMEWAPRTA